MPMYEYKCPECGERFEKLRKMDDADKRLACPHCGHESVERQVSTFAMSGACSPGPGGRFT